MSTSSEEDNDGGSLVNAVHDHDVDDACCDNKQPFQDATGKFWGKRRGILTTYVGSMIYPLARPELSQDYETYRESLDEDEEGDAIENIMKPGGFQLMTGASRGRLEIVFTTSIVGKWPLYIEWMGPRAKIGFMSCSHLARVVHEQELMASMDVMGKNVIERLPFNKAEHYGRIRLVLEESGGGFSCGIAFVFAKPRPPRNRAVVPKVSGLSADLDADEVEKDVTIELKDGATMKVHSLLLRLYSPVYRQRYVTNQWDGSVIQQVDDTKGAWTLLVKSCLYEVEPLNTESEFFMEALEIAYRDDIRKFLQMAWKIVKITTVNVMALLRKAWMFKEENDDNVLVKNCVDNCLHFIFKNMSTFDSGLVIAYTTCLQDYPTIVNYVDELQKRKRRRT